MSNATGRTSAAQVRSASAPRQSFAFDYRMYHDVDDLASDKDSRDKRAEARAKARETAANLVATRDAPARHQGREIVAATFAALDGVAPNNIRSPTTLTVTSRTATSRSKCTWQRSVGFGIRCIPCTDRSGQRGRGGMLTLVV